MNASVTYEQTDSSYKTQGQISVSSSTSQTSSIGRRGNESTDLEPGSKDLDPSKSLCLICSLVLVECSCLNCPAYGPVYVRMVDQRGCETSDENCSSTLKKGLNNLEC